MLAGEARIGFGLTEPLHGSDATWMETTGVRDGDEWVHQRREVLEHRAAPRHPRLHLRPHLGRAGRRPSASPVSSCRAVPGFSVEEFMWTFNMPTDHAHVRLTDVRVSDADILGDEGRGLQTAQLFVHENRIRQAASSLGAGLHCIDVAVEWANGRTTFGKPLSQNQAIQFPLAELAPRPRCSGPDLEDRLAARRGHRPHGDHRQGGHVQLPRQPLLLRCRRSGDADLWRGGYGRAMPFEHIYRHHRRYRITEGSEEIQIRKVAGKLFGYAGRAKG